MFKDVSLVINLEKKNSSEGPMYLKMLAMVLECKRYSYYLFRLCMYSFFFLFFSFSQSGVFIVCGLVKDVKDKTTILNDGTEGLL